MEQTLTIEGNTILDSVIKTLANKFPNIDIYEETIMQGCPHPYMMVFCEDFTEDKLMRKNYLQTFIISVLYQYKPLPETSYIKANDMGYKLAEILDTIELPNGDKIRGLEKHWYPRYQKLEFYINYSIKVAKEKETVPKQMTQKVNVYKKTEVK